MNVVQTTGLKRKTIDKYYTKPSVVTECMNAVSKYLNIDKVNDLCIEPSAGNGAFINSITSLFNNYKFFDIEPESNDNNSENTENTENTEIVKQDYLRFVMDDNGEDNGEDNFEDNGDHAENTGKRKNIYVIGNPPFGRQSSTAIKFIKKSAEFCDGIAFILPKSFKKDSLKKHFPLNFHLVHEFDIPDNAFTINNTSYDVPCVFQIWIKKTFNRPIVKKISPSNYKFVKKEENPDISFRRVGIYAGKVCWETENKSSQSHYFIKFNIELTDAIFNKLNDIKYDCKNNTCGPRSISKQELIKEFNKIL